MARYLVPPLLIILALAALLLYVGGTQMVTLAVLGKTYETTLQIAILLMCGLVVGLIILWSLAVWVWRLPRRMKKGYGRMRNAGGLGALEDALILSEAGDGERARKQARRVRELLGRPALSALVSAKAAEAAMKMDEASKYFTVLLDDEKTQGAGLRGLARIAETQGDFGRVIEMTRSAYQGNGAPKWAFGPLFGAQIAIHDWQGALETLELGQKRKHVDKAVSRRRRAVLYAAQAAMLDASDAAEQQELALEAAIRAHDYDLSFAPACALAARLLEQDGQGKKAAAILEKSWARNPHPALALAYRDLYIKEPAPLRAKKIKGLIRTNPKHRESCILGAEQALQDSDGLIALQALGGVLREEEPSARLCSLAAAAEGLLGNTVDAKAWQLRADSAPLEVNWSDLDPDGPAFNYTPADWRRLIISYGETGKLIHPRFENNKRRRPVVGGLVAEPMSAPASGRPDNPAIILEANEADDLSNRLENLMDDKQKD